MKFKKGQVVTIKDGFLDLKVEDVIWLNNWLIEHNYISHPEMPGIYGSRLPVINSQGETIFIKNPLWTKYKS